MSEGDLVRLRKLEIKELFEEWLRTHYPDRAERVLDLPPLDMSRFATPPQTGDQLTLFDA